MALPPSIHENDKLLFLDLSDEIFVDGENNFLDGLSPSSRRFPPPSEGSAGPPPAN